MEPEPNSTLRVVLVQPSEPFGGMAYIPSSLIGIAAVLRQAGIETTILDARLKNLTVPQTIGQLRELQPHVVGITGLNNAYRFIKDLSWELRRVMPEVKIMAGGPFIMTQPELLMERTPLDAACTAEGEEMVVELSRRLAAGRELDGIPNLAWRKDGRIVRSEIKLIEDFDALPLPAYDLLDMEAYLSELKGDHWYRKFFPVNTGRGCMNHCYYCGRMFKKVRRGSPQRTFDHFRHLQDTYGLSNFLFDEDSAFHPKEWAIELCRLIVDSGRKFNLNVVGCPEQLDDELAGWFKRAGWVQTGVAVEHWNPLIQKLFFRSKQSKHILSAWDSVSRHAVHNEGFNLLWGHPQDSLASFREAYATSQRVVREYDLPHFHMAGLVIYPNSRLQKDAMALGKITDYEDYMYAMSGYGPYVNITPEDDDAYRAFFTEHGLEDALRLHDRALADPSLAADQRTRIALRRKEIAASLFRLRDIMALPREQRAPHRTELETMLGVEIYDKDRNHYQAIACFEEIMAMPRGSRIMAFDPPRFKYNRLMRLFNSLRESGVELAGFASEQPHTREFEGNRVYSLRELEAVPYDALVKIVDPDADPGETGRLQAALPGAKIVTITRESLRSKIPSPGVLVGTWVNEDHYDCMVENGEPRWSMRLPTPLRGGGYNLATHKDVA